MPHTKTRARCSLSLPPRLLLSHNSRQARRNLLAALRKIFRNVIKHLRAIVRRRLRPTIRAFRAASTAFRMSLRLPSGASPSNFPSVRHALRRYSPNPAAPAFRRYKASRCDRSTMIRPRLRTFSPPRFASHPPSSPPSAAGAFANHAGSRYSQHPFPPPSRPYPLSR